jgi:hypothetical protein
MKYDSNHDDDDVIGPIFARARALDPLAWAAPLSRRSIRRRDWSLKLALDEYFEVRGIQNIMTKPSAGARRHAAVLA